MTLGSVREGRVEASPRRRSTAPIAILGLAVLAIIVVARIVSPAPGGVLPDRLQDALTLAISVLVESLPFVVLGIAVAVAGDEPPSLRELYRPPDGAAILELTASPGGQFAVVELDPDAASGARDGMSAHPRPLAVRTIVIDVASGAVVADLAGGGLRWDAG